MIITFESMDNPYSDEVFFLLKNGIHPYVEKVFGWSDAFQRKRLKEHYQPEWFYWVFAEDEKVGFVCFKRYEGGLHLHLMVISKEHQGLGIGKRVMATIHRIAHSEQRQITLSSFKCNQRAVNLYLTLGYEVTDEEEHFLLFRLPYSKHRPETNAVLPA